VIILVVKVRYLISDASMLRDLPHAQQFIKLVLEVWRCD
jgi:hypothetical protein